MKVLVLGTGPIGKEICLQLICEGHRVFSVDVAVEEIEGHHYHHHMDIWDFIKEHIDLIRRNDLIINALPGNISYEIIKTLIPLGINIIDVSFMQEDITQLKELAELYQTQVIYDCGIAPGLCNIILGHYFQKKSKIKEYICFVGGMPENPIGPYYHKTLFSIKDLLSEYIRPARCRHNGENMILNPLTKIQELSHIKHFETTDLNNFEVFPTDGLRSLLNLDIPNMTECTLRHPGHLTTMSLLQESGFLDPEHIDWTAEVLSNKWKMQEGDIDFLLMYLMIEYNNTSVVYRIYDKYQNGVTAMARTTAYSCLAIINTLMGGYGIGKIPFGITSPEEFIQYINDDEAFSWIIKYLQDKGISITRSQ